MAETIIGEIPAPARRGFGGRVMRVLFLDDHRMDRRRLIETSREAGLEFEASEAANLDELSEALNGARFDLVFIDFHLGFDTGLDALAALRAHNENGSAIAIMVTSNGATETVVEAMRAGCSDYLVKDSLTVDSLRRAVAGAVERNMMLAAVTEQGAGLAEQAQTSVRYWLSCGPEMKRLSVGLLQQIADIRALIDQDDEGRLALRRLQSDGGKLFALLDEMSELTADAATPKPTFVGQTRSLTA